MIQVYINDFKSIINYIHCSNKDFELGQTF